MKFYEAKRFIAAPAARVWTALTDANALVAEDTGISRIDGRIALNEKIKLWTDISPRVFSLKIVEFEPDRRMVWKGGMPLGLFTGVRQFNLSPSSSGTEFHLREEFSGPMLPLIWKSMPDLQPSFDAFANWLQSSCQGEQR